MAKRIVVPIVLACGLLLGVIAPQANAADPQLMDSGANIRDTASLQRGAKLFMNYCVGCHSLHFMRYSRIAHDLGLSKKDVMSNLDFTRGKFHDNIVSAMPRKMAKTIFGKPPPDLSVMVNLKGADWVYTYLNTFYLDPTTATGWNNVLVPNVAMPFPLWTLQGIQVPKMDPPKGGGKPVMTGLKLAQPGSMTPEQYHAATRDITAFLEYVSDPSAIPRHSMAPWVLLYFAGFAFLAWLLKHEYWKDVH